MVSDAPSGSIGYDCNLCLAKELMGSRNGRLCLIYQIDLESDRLRYSGESKIGKVSGTISSESELYGAVDELLSTYASDRIAVGLKRISLEGGISGVCVKSFPKSQLTSEILGLLNICLGGHNGTDLVHLPCSGTILDQPNIFIESYFIYVNEYSKYWKEQRESESNKSKAKDESNR